jgi:hypothetical protein
MVYLNLPIGKDDGARNKEHGAAKVLLNKVIRVIKNKN